MQLLIMKGIMLVLVFLLTLVFCLLPLKILPRTPLGYAQNKKSLLIMSCCNCVSGGVFMGTYLLALMPFVRDKFAEVFQLFRMRIDYPVAECSVALGFFVILVLEKTIIICQKSRERTVKKKEMIEMPRLPSSSDESEIDDSEDDRERLTNHKKGCAAKSGQPCQKKNGVSYRPHNHGHGHSHMHVADVFKKTSGLRCFLLLLALSTHGLFEGLAVGLQDTHEKLISLYIAVVVHECLVSFAMGVSIAKQRLKMGTAVKIAVFLCIMIPVGMGAGMAIDVIHGYAGALASAIIQGITAGTFLYVTFLEILPAEINGEEYPLVKVLFLFLGLALVGCLRVLHFEGGK